MAGQSRNKKFIVFAVIALAVIILAASRINTPRVPGAVSGSAPGKAADPQAAAAPAGAGIDESVLKAMVDKAVKDAAAAAAKAAPRRNAPESFTDVAKRVGPAVVSISAERIQKVPGRKQFFFGPGNKDFFGDDFFDEFFKDFFGEIPDREFKQMGLGSGVIIDPKGLILTNEHVISGADSIAVSLPDGREFEAHLKGADARSDLAIIKIDSKEDLPSAKMGDSSALDIGEWVVAIGNPFGFAVNSPEPTVTVGVVSAVHRSLPNFSRARGKERAYLDLIQTDAAINPGNSGGPLCNMKGEIVGVNVAIVSTSGGYQGLGFAIPSNLAGKIVDDLIEGREVEYGWMGVTIQEITEDLAKYFGLSEKAGVLVSSVLKDGPAQAAGIKSGDIIVAISGQKVKDSRDVLRKVGHTKPGEEVAVTVIRNRKEITVPIIVGKRPQSPEEAQEAAIDNSKEAKESTWRGIKITEITPELAKKMNIEDTEGVIIARIAPQSPAHEAGLQSGDIIREINQSPVKNAEDFKTVTLELKGNALIRTDKGFAIVKEKEEKKEQPEEPAEE